MNIKGNRHLIWYNLEHKPYPALSHDSGSICHFSFAKLITRSRASCSSPALSFYFTWKSPHPDIVYLPGHGLVETGCASSSVKHLTALSRPLHGKQREQTYKRISENCDKAPPACLYTIDYWVLDSIIIRFAFLIFQSPTRWSVHKYYKASGGLNWFANNWKL